MSRRPVANKLARPVCTWLTATDYERLLVIAKMSECTVATFIRSVIVDALNESREALLVPKA